MRKILASLCTVFLLVSVKAQDPHFSQFFASPLTLNPAFTGKFDGSWRLAANHRDQWHSPRAKCGAAFVGPCGVIPQRAGRRLRAAATDPDDGIDGGPGLVAGSFVARHRIGNAAPVCDRHRRRHRFGDFLHAFAAAAGISVFFTTGST